MPEQPPLIEGIEPLELIDQTHEAERRLFEDGLANLPFGGLYWSLRQEGWYFIDAAYIAWKSLPRKARYPEKLSELADLLGTSARNIQLRRQKNPQIESRAMAATLAGEFLDRAGDVIDALIESATTPDYKNHADRKLYLEMAGIYTPKQELGLTARSEAPEEELTEEELRRRAKMLEAGEGVDAG